MQCLTDMGVADKIFLVTQPANSPDLNVNDLGFFNQATHHCSCPRNQIELIDMVTETFNEHPTEKINRIWLTCQSVLNKVIKHAGCNLFKLPHMGKEKPEKEGRLPAVLDAHPAARHCLEN